MSHFFSAVLPLPSLSQSTKRAEPLSNPKKCGAKMQFLVQTLHCYTNVVNDILIESINNEILITYQKQKVTFQTLSWFGLPKFQRRLKFAVDVGLRLKTMLTNFLPVCTYALTRPLPLPSLSQSVTPLPKCDVMNGHNSNEMSL